MEPYEIMVLGPDDSELARRLLDCFGDAFDDPASYCAAQPNDGYLRALLSQECFVAIVAVIDGDVVGGLAGYVLQKLEQPRSEFYIYDLAVREAHRRRGIATALIEACKDVARARGAWMVYVQADLVDAPALALYAGLGTREDVVHFDIPPG